MAAAGENWSLRRPSGWSCGTLRRLRGISQEELGFDAGYHRTYVGLLERGRKSPSLKTIFKLARALRVKPSQIVQGVETMLRR